MKEQNDRLNKLICILCANWEKQTEKMMCGNNRLDLLFERPKVLQMGVFYFKYFLLVYEKL